MRRRRRTSSTILAAALISAPLAAQSRNTVLVGPPALGAICYVRHVLPTGSVGHVAGFLWSGPFAGAVAVPGLAVNGVLLVDPAAFVALGLTLTNGVDLPSLALAVPYLPSVLGSQLDCQSFDLDLAGVFQLAGNDVTLTVVDGPSATLNMAPIAPGTFQMGSPTINNSTQPVHQVTLSVPFWMGKYEVMQAEYQSVLGSNPSYFASGPNAPLRPVEQVSWNSAVAYCQALTATEQAAGRVPAGYQYRLPTEAEWEYCCRAGTTTEWNTGTSLSTSQANFGGVIGQTTTVGSYAPNAFGLHDMHGNVREWCLDSYALYAPGPVTDPFVTGGPYRVFRGGSWHTYSTAPVCRSASRHYFTPGYADSNLGFRIVLAPVLVP
ncbi:MAG: formylglycine-generating enzyme family protein [Planctomycetes bacterium]|nr:formylglycine-generating enzyme family protein [Planctomycetota bacterium]